VGTSRRRRKQTGGRAGGVDGRGGWVCPEARCGRVGVVSFEWWCRLVCRVGRGGKAKVRSMGVCRSSKPDNLDMVPMHLYVKRDVKNRFLSTGSQLRQASQMKQMSLEGAIAAPPGRPVHARARLFQLHRGPRASSRRAVAPWSCLRRVGRFKPPRYPGSAPQCMSRYLFRVATRIQEPCRHQRLCCCVPAHAVTAMPLPPVLGFLRFGFLSFCPSPVSFVLLLDFKVSSLFRPC
jgi:hypothetical protein